MPKNLFNVYETERYGKGAHARRALRIISGPNIIKKPWFFDISRDKTLDIPINLFIQYWETTFEYNK